MLVLLLLLLLLLLLVLVLLLRHCLCIHRFPNFANDRTKVLAVCARSYVPVQFLGSEFRARMHECDQLARLVALSFYNAILPAKSRPAALTFLGIVLAFGVQCLAACASWPV